MLAATSAGLPYSSGPYAAQVWPNSDSVGSPVNPSQARLTQVTRSA